MMFLHPWLVLFLVGSLVFPKIMVALLLLLCNPPLVATERSLFMYYQNVRGLRSKTKDFFIASSSCDFVVILLLETWLKPSIYVSELFSSKYVVYRCDRSSNNSVYENSGGVLVVPNSLCVKFRAVKLSFCCFNFLLCCIYIPSGASQEI